MVVPYYIIRYTDTRPQYRSPQRRSMGLVGGDRWPNKRVLAAN